MPDKVLKDRPSRQTMFNNLLTPLLVRFKVGGGRTQLARHTRRQEGRSRPPPPTQPALRHRVEGVGCNVTQKKTRVRNGSLFLAHTLTHSLFFSLTHTLSLSFSLSLSLSDQSGRRQTLRRTALAARAWLSLSLSLTHSLSFTVSLSHSLFLSFGSSWTTPGT